MIHARLLSRKTAVQLISKIAGQWIHKNKNAEERSDYTLQPIEQQFLLVPLASTVSPQ